MRKPLNQYKAVFFDVGDTLMTIPAARVIMQQFLALRSLHREQDRIGELFTQAFRLFYYGKQLNPDEVCSPESDRAFWMKIYLFILGELGADAEWTEDQMHHCCHDLYDLFTAPEHYQLFGDVKESLEELKKLGFRLGIVSNFAPTLKRILEEKGILRFFDPVIVSTEVGLEKPNPAIFRLALEQSGLDASEVLYIGDHDQNDIWAPQQVGIDALKILRYDYLKITESTCSGDCSISGQTLAAMGQPEAFILAGSSIHSLKELLK